MDTTPALTPLLQEANEGQEEPIELEEVLLMVIIALQVLAIAIKLATYYDLLRCGRRGNQVLWKKCL